MTQLRCVCGAIVEGSDEELLEAVERHLAEEHSAALDRPDDDRDEESQVPGAS